ncbi:MAG: tRNA (N(6)-L-threonylcarbamoyladenosine(37)-C(2))-methylthiotransferase MtaB [Dissulfurispiraceae bacterium]
MSVLTLGCRTNQAESLHIENSLCQAGHQMVDLSDNPDICIINSCSVTAKADNQSRQLIRRALTKDAKIFITGCYAQLNEQQIKELAPDTTVVSNADKYHLISEINALSSTTTVSSKKVKHHRPIIKVQDGCNYACSYCVIPQARGRSKSTSIDEVVRTVSHYHYQGYQEVVLSGIHLGTYGLDLNPKKKLSDLLKEVLRATSVPRIRISSIELKEIDNELLDLMSDNRICHHLHVPLQSGDDEILKLMNRTYTVKEYRTRIDTILSTLSDPGLGTDVLVGFPGESEKKFRNTQMLLENYPFTYIHVFPFSPRPRTQATLLANTVRDEVKRERVAVLSRLSLDKKNIFIGKNIGKTFDVIAETQASHGLTGTSRNYIKVSIESGTPILPGMLVDIRLKAIKSGVGIGVPTNKSKPSHL